MEGRQRRGEEKWADNPRLNLWTAAQAAAFETRSPLDSGGWDFSIESLDRLEDLLRRRFASYEDIMAAHDTELVSVAAWYLGEVHVRHYGAQWRCRPEPDPQGLGNDQPYVTIPVSRADEYPPADDDPDGDGRPLTVPVNELDALFLRGPGHHLRDTLTRYRPRTW
ncbi:hypothetical protein [Saccharomonospora cyanea]|uniref:Uncharacterized protein n=1 Tax=Saccharomonospora cyanea NA-134 TaxID=882082 RepID=H5XMP0_9PSEU|nr:hypothetical protein [Saccharomonospora cyanea]EHR61019.1 hypothetical protein SaccyDRAFT_2128 [Saccharomonospora cyanea NA-134]